jgi:hypothetical protein
VQTQTGRINSSTLFLSLFLATTGSALAQNQWFTVTGHPEVTDKDTVQVDPISVSAHHKSLNIRVSRDAMRTSWDGVPYRSYTATVLIDCNLKSGRYLSLHFYMQPVWMGESHKSVVYPDAVIRPMRFLDMAPNPTERIIRAACPPASSGAVTPGAQK